MKKFLSLDIGDKRIGVATSQGKIVASWGIIDNSNLTEASHEIGNICRREQIQKIIIGMPKSPNPLQADKIHKFAMELAKNLPLAVAYVDETLTSKEAERKLKDQNLDPKSTRFKEEVDKLSAKYILEQYINKSQISNLKSQK